jgi:hypothetical protein
MTYLPVPTLQSLTRQLSRSWLLSDFGNDNEVPPAYPISDNEESAIGFFEYGIFPWHSACLWLYYVGKLNSFLLPTIKIRVPGQNLKSIGFEQ